MFRYNGVVAGVHHDEASGAVGVLGHAGRRAALTEQRGLLIAGDSGDRDAIVGLSDHFTRRDYPRQNLPRDFQDSQQIVVPFAAVDVEEERAGRICHIGHVHAAAGQSPDEPCIDGSEGQAFPSDMVQKPTDLRP